MSKQIDLMKELEKAIKATGGQNKWAKENGISQTLVSQVLNKKRPFAPKIARKLGYHMTVTYPRVETLEKIEA